MELIISKLLLRQFHCASLAKEFETEDLTTYQRAGLAYRWDDMRKESYVLQLVMDLIGRLEKEKSGYAGPRIPKA